MRKSWTRGLDSREEVLVKRVEQSSEEVLVKRVEQSSEEVLDERVGHSSEGREGWTVK